MTDVLSIATNRPPLNIGEADFRSYVLRLARAGEWLEYWLPDSRRVRGRGFPDLVLLRAPVLVFAELKTEQGRLRVDQKNWAAELGQVDGIEHYIWRPSDWDNIADILA